MRTMTKHGTILGGGVLIMALLTGSAGAEVLDAGAGGFSTRHRVEIAATRMQVWESLVADIGSWWNDSHTMSGSAANLYIEPRPQGCFCETLSAGAGLVHMTVTFVNPGVLLRLAGGLGPLGLMGVAGNMTFDFDESDGVTFVTLQYAVGGYAPEGLDTIATAVDGVLAEQLEGLKDFVESARTGQ
jgi:hypothetical protein